MNATRASLRVSIAVVILATCAIADSAIGQDAQQPVVSIDVRVIQPMGKDGGAATGNDADQRKVVKPQRLTTGGDGLAVYIAPVGQAVELAGRVFHVANPTDDKEAQDARDKLNGVWTQIAGPRLAWFVQQPASIRVGSTQVPYMKQREDGSLVIEYVEECEGLSIDAEASAADAAGVTLEQLAVRITKLVGREPIPGVPFDVGRPILRTLSISTSLRLAPDRTAIIEMPTADENEQPVFVLIQARRAEPDSD